MPTSRRYRAENRSIRGRPAVRTAKDVFSRSGLTVSVGAGADLARFTWCHKAEDVSPGGELSPSVRTFSAAGPSIKQPVLFATLNYANYPSNPAIERQS